MVWAGAARAGLARITGHLTGILGNPIVAGTATALVLVLFVAVPYLQLLRATETTTQRRADLMAEQAALRVQAFLTSTINAIATLTARENAETFRSEAAFASFAADIHRAFPGLVAVNRVDNDYVIAWVYPADENRSARGIDLSGHPQAGETIREADRAGAPRMTPGLTLLQGGTGFAIYIPRTDSGRRAGFVNLAFRDRDLLSQVFPSWDDPGSSLAVWNGRQIVFSLGETPPEQWRISSAAPVPLLNQTWRVSVTLARNDQPPMLLLSVGIVLAAGIGFAVTEVLRRRRVTMEAERRLALVGLNAPAVIYQRVLWPDGRVTFPYVSPGIERLLGASASATQLKQDPLFISRRILPEDVERVGQSVRRSAEAMTPWNEEFRIRRDDGSVIWLNGVSRPHRDTRGNVVWDGILIEITERKQAELALARSEEQLQQLHRMESIGQLSGGVAHDFNNLLMIILGNLDLASDRQTEPAKARDAITVAIGAAERGAELTRQLLAFARRQALMPKAVKVNELVLEVESMLRRTLGRHIAIELSLADAPWDAFCDPAQLEGALINLAVNARDAMPVGGVVRISTANRTLDAAAAQAHPDVRAGDYVSISVADTGVGMAPEVKARAFEPFFTTKEIGRGTGLGLPMVYGFVKQSGGHIDLESAPERGTRITLYLPRA